MKIQHFDNGLGYVDNGNQVFTFEILSQSSILEINQLTTDNFYNNMSDYWTMKFNDLFIAPYDKTHNNLPLEIKENIKANHILGELIEKQIKYLYGQGPYLYKN
jgi:hypothetical protein